MINCKTCGTELNGKYCSNCGRPFKLKRIDAHYIKHEIEHLLHFDKGIFYTTKELISKPGKSIKEFLTEDRNRLVKPIIFIIVTSLVYTFVNQYFHIEDQYVKFDETRVTTAGKIMKWIQEHYGYANILMGIFIALFIKLFFRKSNYNIYEIMVLLCFVMGIGMLILALFALVQVFVQFDVMQIAGLLFIVYASFAIADFFDRKKAINYFKSLSAYLLGMVAFFISAIILGNLIDLIIKH